MNDYILREEQNLLRNERRYRFVRIGAGFLALILAAGLSFPVLEEIMPNELIASMSRAMKEHLWALWWSFLFWGFVAYRAHTNLVLIAHIKYHMRNCEPSTGA